MQTQSRSHRGRGRWANAALALAIGASLLAAPTATASEGDPSDKAMEKAQRYYDQAVRFTRRGRAAEALKYFELALPKMNGSSDIFYNLVQVSNAAKDWRRLIRYAQGFLFLEPGSGDAKAIKKQMTDALARLERAGKAPVKIAFEVEPAGTDVFVDHVPVSRSKITEVLLFPGAHEASASRADYKPWRAAFEVKAGSPATIKGALDKEIHTGKLKVATVPAEGVDVYVNDELVGTTPLEPIDLPTVKVLVRFDKPGYERWVRYVAIERDATAELAATLEKKAGAAPTP